MKKWWMVKYEGDPQALLRDEKYSGAICRRAKTGELTSEAVANWLDRKAENQNNHQFVGAYTRLREILLDAGVEEPQIADAMLLIAEDDGLMG